MIKLVKILIAGKKKSFWRFFTFLLVISFTISIIYEFYNFGNREFENVISKTKISLIIKDSTDDSGIQKILLELKHNKKIHSIVYIPSDEAEKDFFAHYDTFSKDLLNANPFPPVIDIVLEKKYFDSRSIYYIVKKLRNNSDIQEMRYRKDFIHSFLILKTEIIQYFLTIAISSLIIFILLIYFLVKPDLALFPEYMKKYESHDFAIDNDINNKKRVSNFTCMSAINTFILLKTLVSVFLISLIFFTIWWFLKENISLVAVISIRKILAGVLFAGGLTILVSIVTSFIVETKHELTNLEMEDDTIEDESIEA